MDINIKEKIVNTAQALFLTKDYDSVTMRDISGKLGISVGNLTYHYSKKEDILMTIHDRLFASFHGQLSPEWRCEHGISGFFAVEYAFHRFIVDDPGFYRLYNQVINSFVLRSDYYRRHLELLKTFVGDKEADHSRFENLIIAMSSMEFHFMETGALSADFDSTFRKMILGAMLFSKDIFHDAECYGIAQTGIQEGHKLYRKIYVKDNEPSVQMS